MPPHPVTNFEIQRYYQNESKFNDVYSRNNLFKINYETYIIDLDEYKSIENNWKALYMNAENVTYFDSFGVEYIPKEIRIFIGSKYITTNICRIQTYDSVMCGYFCIYFIDFMLKGKTLLGYTNLFFSNENKNNGKIILKYFQ